LEDVAVDRKIILKHDERKTNEMHFSKQTMDLKYQLAPTCFVASGAPSSESPK
jgi:hypothetical protein